MINSVALVHIINITRNAALETHRDCAKSAARPRDFGPSVQVLVTSGLFAKSNGAETQNLTIIKLGLHPHTKPTCPRGVF